jgi:hypothetical protein
LFPNDCVDAVDTNQTSGDNSNLDVSNNEQIHVNVDKLSAWIDGKHAIVCRILLYHQMY